jgi:hypothetical protein
MCAQMGNPSFRQPTHEERMRRINRQLAQLADEREALLAERKALEAKQPEGKK